MPSTLATEKATHISSQLAVKGARSKKLYKTFSNVLSRAGCSQLVLSLLQTRSFRNIGIRIVRQRYLPDSHLHSSLSYIFSC